MATRMQQKCTIHAVGQSNVARLQQQGAALITSLIILLVMTIIGITSMQTTTMDEKMVGNMRDLSIALQAAESALREGEGTTAEIDTFTYDGSTGTVGQYAEDATIDVYSSTTWSDSNSIEYAGSLYTGPSLQVAAKPRYILQYRGELPVDAGIVSGTGYGGSASRHAIRTYSRGNGLTNNTEIFLQSDSVVLR